MTTRRHRRLLAVVALSVLVAAGLVLARPRKGDVETGSPTDSGTTAPPSILPLLGIEGELRERAALAVRIENTAAGRPQSGLAEDGAVYEEVVEGGLTRLLAVCHSQDPETVGPVRSARSTDLSIRPELGRPLFAWSGANPTFAAAVEALLPSRRGHAARGP